MSENKDKDESEDTKIVIKNNADLQRLKLSKLMKNPDKPIIIPERPKERGIPNVPDFVRNVMGSSAGAGSGEFHVYRHLRRKEYARQKFMQEKAERDKLDDDYHKKLEEYQKLAEQQTEKKRLKRLKKKQKKKKKSEKSQDRQSSSEHSEHSDEEHENKETPMETTDNNESTNDSKEDMLETKDSQEAE
ncbi:unnamed protein product [Psylliodes chrysocephalus]|uniref:PRKR-interacting protein 1 n=1 Tax=Psylliodes chrysocephalus TaxID=3402493 RepID=A0A9P0CLI8_9CUCU|nr:unnamed protein product [Psylliodes chrysocephala]